MELLSSWKSWKNQEESTAYVILQQIFVLSSSSSSLTKILFAETPCQGTANGHSPAPIKSESIALLLPPETAWFVFLIVFPAGLTSFFLLKYPYFHRYQE